jgi:hypothetical protein
MKISDWFQDAADAAGVLTRTIIGIENPAALPQSLPSFRASAAKGGRTSRARALATAGPDETGSPL